MTPKDQWTEQCSTCSGIGMVVIPLEPEVGFYDYALCPKCGGDGELQHKPIEATT